MSFEEIMESRIAEEMNAGDATHEKIIEYLEKAIASLGPEIAMAFFVVQDTNDKRAVLLHLPLDLTDEGRQELINAIMESAIGALVVRDEIDEKKVSNKDDIEALLKKMLMQ